MSEAEKTPHKNIPLIVSLLGVIIITFVWLLARTDTKSQPITKTETSLLVSNDIKNLEEKSLYTNTTYKFSVEYPKDFKLEEFASKYDDTFNVSITNYELTTDEDAVKPDGMDIQMAVGGDTFKRSDFYYGGYRWTQSIFELLVDAPVGTAKDHEYDTITKLEDITVGEFKGIKYKAVSKTDTGTEGVTRINVALLSNGRSFHVTGKTINSDLMFTEPHSEIFDSIVSSIKTSEE